MSSMAGAYLPLDGTVEFYGRVCALIKPTDVVLDLGAGRGAWYFEEPCEYIKSVRNLKPRVKLFYGADVDGVVLTNPTTHENLLIREGRIPLPDQSLDLVIVDYVFEHIQDPKEFCAEISRVLKPNGYLCARTPHKYCYISVAARFIKNARHADVLSIAQPKRKVVDIFPTAFRLNTINEIRQHFKGYEDYSYLYASEPQYYFGRKYVYFVLEVMQRILPTLLSSNIFVFMRKPAS
jgi:SAM-dependent methyltransferase